MLTVDNTIEGLVVQVVPGFDAKGIETVRRDTCPAVAKTMERSLRLLFATRDLSEVQSCIQQLPKLMSHM